MTSAPDDGSDLPDENAAPAPREYEVGYGRPPKATQFQKGRSGNPRGRPKGKRGLKSDLRAELTAMVEITENGRKMTLSKQRVIVKQLVARAAKGDLRAIEKLSTLVLGVFGPEDETPPEARGLSADDAAIIAAFEARREGQKDDPQKQAQEGGDGSQGV